MSGLRWLTKRRRSHDEGVASVELVGMLPVLLFVMVALLQVGVVGWTASSTAEAARSAARAASLGNDPMQAAKNALPGALTPQSVTGSNSGNQAKYTVTVEIPGIGFFSSPGAITRTVVMPDLVQP